MSITEPRPGETTDQAEARIRDWRARGALRGAAELAEHVRAIAISGKSEAGETTREWSAPMRIEAADDIDAVYAQLINWIIYWAETLGIAAPSTSRVAWSNFKEVQGFRAGTTPGGAKMLTRLQTMWLLDHADQIKDDFAAAAYHDDVIKFIWETRTKYPMKRGREKETVSRACPNCSEYTVTADWFGANLGDVDVQCEYCGWSVPPRYYKKQLDFIDWYDDRPDHPADLRILTVKQPWAWLIINGGKDVENRDWKTDYRGPVAIHAGLDIDEEAMRSLPMRDPSGKARHFLYGQVIGVVDLVDVTELDFGTAEEPPAVAPSKWAERGKKHWILDNPRPLGRPITVRGAQGLHWTQPELTQLIRQQDPDVDGWLR